MEGTQNAAGAAEDLFRIFALYKKEGPQGPQLPRLSEPAGRQKFKALVPIIRGSDHRNLLASNENLP